MFVNKKKNQYEKEINCIFGEKKKESNEMTLTEKRRIRNFKHSMIYKISVLGNCKQILSQPLGKFSAFWP